MSNTDIEDILSLSPIQKGVLFHSLYAPDAGVYFQQVHCVLRGNLDLQAFRQAWQQLINRHSILRTSFFWEDLEEPVQVVNREVTLPIEVEDWSELSDSEQQSRFLDFLEADRRRGFELSSAPLLRLVLLRLDEQRYRLVWSHHHLLLDGWSIPLLLKEVFTVYEGLCWKEPVQLAPARPYGDYITWLQRQPLEEAERYWSEKLRGLKSPTTLALGRGREARAEGESEYRDQRLNLSAAETAELSAVARRHQLTLNTIVQGAWGLLLSRYSSEPEVLFGTTVAGRPAALRGVEQMVGMFINTLPMRVRIDETEQVSEWLQRLQAEAVEMRQYEHSPLVEVAKWSEMPRGTPLFESVLVFENYPINSNGSERNGKNGIPTIEDVSYYWRANYPLTIIVAPRNELKWTFSYEADLFDDETIRRMMGHFRQLLRGIATDPQQRICDLSLLTDEERQQLLAEFNDTKTKFPQELCLHQLFEQQVARNPEQVAVVFGEEKVSYRELNERANQLAHRLQRLGVGPEVLVGVLLERSVEMVVALLGILKAGGAYLPLDPAYPLDRLSFMMADAGATVLLTQNSLRGTLPQSQATVVRLDTEWDNIAKESTENPAAVLNVSNLAYVIYTSGSTGRPKGVMVTHANVGRLFTATEELFRFDEQDVWTLFHSYAFDFSVWELWGALLYGGRLVVVPYWVSRTPQAFYELLMRERVTVLNQTPSAFRQLLVAEQDRAPLDSLRYVIFGGEALELSSLREWFARHGEEQPQMINMYGITETTVHVTYRRIREKDVEGRNTSPIGHGLKDLELYVLDQRGELVPAGVAGELYVGGGGVARGYLGRPELTAERFVVNPYGAGRLYRTGDVVRWRGTDEGFEYVGRADTQVKVRGFRIEVGEIESRLGEHEGIRESVVMLREAPGGDKRLVAYIVPDEEYISMVGEQPLHHLPNDLSVFHLNRNETEHLYREIFQDGSYLRHGVTLLDGDCVFDVGANIGLFTLFAQQHGLNVKTFAFEPSPVAFEKLRLNVERFGLQASLFDCGLSNKETTATFTYYPQASVMSGFYPNAHEEKELFRTFMLNQPHAGGDEEKALLNEFADELTDARFESQSFTCRLRTISSVIAEHNIESIDLLKVDVEKSEADVLEGIDEHDWPKIKQVVVEVHDIEGRLNRVLSLLRRHGFEIAQEVLAEGTGVYNIFARRSTNGHQRRKAQTQTLRIVNHYTLTSGDLRAFLQEKLPDYMIPSNFILLEKFPLTPNGKLDRRALPELKGTETSTARGYVAPQTQVEEILAGIWSEVLHVERVGVNDNLFELGGHSLLATQIVSRVREAFGIELPLRSLFESPTIGRMASRVEEIMKNQQEAPAPPVRPVPRDADLPLSLAQQRLWVFDRMTPGSFAYNIPLAIRVSENLDIAVLQRTFDEIIRRHESLRTTFPEENGQPRQVISPPAPASLPIVDLSFLSKEDREREARRLAQQEGRRPFDLANGPLIRVGLLKLGEQDHMVLLTMHHIVSDGWSMGVLLNEVTTLYAAFSRGEPSPLPEPVIQYADYAVWQREWLQGEVLDQQVSYWRQQLEGAPALLELPTDKPRPAIQTFRGTIEPVELSAELTANLNKLSRQHNVTLFMLLLAAYQLLLHRYTGRKDFVTGSPIAGRTHVETESLIGFFVNTLPLRARFTRELTVEELLRQVREVTLGAYAHQELPFESLVEALQPERNLGYNPVFQAGLGLQNTPQGRTSGAADAADAPGTAAADNDAEPPLQFQGAAKFDLLFALGEGGGVIRGVVEYNTDLFSAQRVQRLIGHYKQLLTAMVNNPQQHVSELPLLTETEQQLLQGLNDIPRALPPAELCVHQLFEEQVGKTPDAVALVHEDEQLSYAELNGRANQLAHYLRRNGVGVETVVGVCLPRGVNQLVALLAVLKSGAAYLPLEPGYPAERLASLLEETGATLVLTEAELAPSLPPAVRQLVFESVQPELAQLPTSDSQIEVAPESLAYITQGLAQGIAVTHAGLLTAVQSSTEMLDLTANDRVLELSSPARDDHLLTVFATLLRGATLTLSAKEANVLSAPVARFLELRREADLEGLSTVILYGDSISPRLVDSLPGKRFLHVRELPGATIFQLSREYQQAESQWPMLIPYERRSQVEFYVLDRAFQPVPMGITGELFIAVSNRQRGYAASAEHTAAAFVPNPFSSEAGSRLYASGFKVRLEADGRLQYLGNLQEQVDINGYRVSLKEIEAVVTQHSAVLHTVISVDVDEEAGKRVVAYVVPDETAATPALSDLQNVIDYLRPAAYVVLDQLPLSVEDEVELTALPKAEVKTVTAEYVAPQSPLEIILARIWMDVLEVEKISVHDNFFNLGGHSLLATMANLQVSDTFGIEVPVTVLFEAQTIAEFANKLLQDPTDGQRIEQIAALRISMEEMAAKVKALTGKEPAAAEQAAGEKQATAETSSLAIRPVPRDRDLPLSFAQQQLWVFDRMTPGSSAYNVPISTRLTMDLDIAVLQRTLDEVIRRHESLRTTFPEENGQPRQVISPPAPAFLPIIDLSFLAKEVREREARRLAQQEAQRPFDLANGPLMRVGVIKLGAQEHLVLLTMHHIVSDGWSMTVLLNEINTLYAAFSRGEPSPLPEPVLQYADYAVWQREWLQGEVLDQEVSYWRQQLEDAPALLELPTDKPRPAIQAFRGTTEPFELSAELTANLNKLSRQHNVTLYMLLLAAYQLLLHRYTGQKDILVGGAIAGRTRVGTESLIGYFVNTLPLRGRFTRELTAEELLRQVREVTVGAYAHQELPFENLVGQLQPERNLSYTPLVQVMFVLQNIPQTRSNAATAGAADVADAPRTATNDNGAEPPPLMQGTGTTKFDMTLWVAESGGGIRGGVEYNTDLFSAQRVQRFIGHYKQLLYAMVNNPQQRLSELPLLTETEQQLLHGLNYTARALPPAELCAHELFEEQAARTPEAVALVHEDEQLSYAELNGRANQLAHYLRRNGVGVETRVGVCLPRGVNQLVALLAVLKSGAAYLPLEPGYPAERLAAMLEETGATLVLTEAELAPSLPPAVRQLEFETVQPELAQLSASDGQLDIAPDSLAYFTQGIAVTHAGLLTAVQSSTEMLDFSASDRVLDLSSPARDAHLLTVFATLLRGATLTLSAKEANVLSAPVARFLELRREADLSGFSTVILYGDSLSPRLAESFPGKRFLHVRELPGATILQLSREYQQGEQLPMLIPYERGSQVELYVLDKAFQPVPMGVTGELFIAVSNRQRGFVGGAELTASAFVPNPFSSEAGSRLYASGFKVRLDADGKLQYLGNLQEQVDVGICHLSLKEIEAVVIQRSAVLHSVITVDVDEESGKRVIAYVVPDETAATLPALSDLQNVADYLRPAAYVVLDQLPLSVEGEVELAALPKAEVKTVTTEYVAPQSPLEITLAKVWMDVLEVEKISVHDNFFNLGGHSLLATMANLQVSDTFGIEVPVTVLFEAPTIAEFANKLLQDPTDGQRIEQIAASLVSGEEVSDEAKEQAAAEMSSSPIRPVPRDGDLPLSFAQQRLWVFDQMAPGSPVYNISLPMRLPGHLDLAVLQRTFNEIIRRHESLRTTFRDENGQPLQVISPPAQAPLPIIDLSFLSKEVRERDALRMVRQGAFAPFDLKNGPLVRVGVIKLGEQDHFVLLTMHHIVSDGWSMGVLRNEVIALYAAFSRGEPSPLPEPVIQYADYAVWQREWLQGEVLEKHVSYWRQQLEGAPDVLELPTDKPRPAIQTFRGLLEPLEISAELTAKLNEMARQHNVTLYMLLLAAYQLLLHRYTGQKDILVGGAIAGRTRVGTESLIGFLVNMLTQRGRFTRELTVEELLQQVREVTLGAYEHQELPFDNLVEELQPERSLSYQPLIQTMFGLQNPPRSLVVTNDDADVADAPSAATYVPPSAATDDNGAEPPPPLLQGTAKFDQTLSLVESDDVIRGVVEYNTDLFTTQRIQRFIGHYKQLLNAMLNNPQQRVSELPLLTEAEQQLLQGLNDKARALPQDLYAHQLFEEQVGKTPDAVALIAENEQLSYAELNARANQLAHYLRRNGVGVETVVGVCLPRGVNQLVTLLAVLKSGAAYLPLEPGYPAERLASLLDETGATLVLTEAGLALSLPPAVRQLEFESVQPELVQLPASDGQLDIAPDSLAYIAEGIAITYAGLLAAVQSSTEMLDLTASDRVLDLSSPARDAHLLTVFATLLRGATLSLSAKEANVLSAPVARFLELRREADLSGLSTVILYGDSISPRLAESFPAKRFLHVRELPGATIFQLSREYQQGEQLPMLIPYERGSQVELYVLDKAFQPVPMGVTGELFIAVSNRQRGFVGGADLTAAAFIPNPFSSEAGSRLYASGFKVRLEADGRLQYLGNLQEQITVGAHHVSLKEIEAVVSQYSAVLHTLIRVDVDEEGGKNVIAYVVPDETAVTLPALSDLQRITDYLRPTAYVVLDQLPLSVEGEVELAALPKADVKTVTEYVAPRSPLEITLAKIWMDVLEVEKISVHDNFFSLGGHSLLATMANLQVSDTFGIEVPVTELFAAPTIAELANRLLQDPKDGQRIEEIAALLLSVEEMSDEAVKELIAKEEVA